MFRVRTLLDSGSMTNWITKALLNYVKYTTKGHTRLEVFTMTGIIQKKFQLVEVYYDHNDKTENLICYVHDNFAKHITVKGLPEFFGNLGNYLKTNAARSWIQLPWMWIM